MALVHFFVNTFQHAAFNVCGGVRVGSRGHRTRRIATPKTGHRVEWGCGICRRRTAFLIVD